jgi:hypothetical protein
VEKVRHYSFGSCSSLADAYFSPDSGRGGHGSDWRLAFNLELLRRLRACFAPVPPPAG